MKYLGIDYGKRRTGLATSDGSIAFAYKVIETSQNLANDIANIVEIENVEKIVIGESKDRDGHDNVIMNDVRDLIGQLSLLVTVPIDTVREDFTTAAALRPLVPEKNVSRSRAKKPVGDTDARAAALLLQRYLETNQK